MNKPILLIKYSEIGVKYGRTRSIFEKMLVKGLKCRLAWFIDSVEKVRIAPGRIIIETSIEPQRAHLLAHEASLVFGVHEAIPAWSTRNDLDSLKEAVRVIARRSLQGVRSFAIRARRVESYPITSKELERILGAEVKDELPGLRVDLQNPERVIHVEVRTRRAYIYLNSWRFKGIGGLPYGVEGNALLAILEPDHDLFAAWLVARRGARLILYHRSKHREAVQEFISKWVPCGDALSYEVCDPLQEAGVRAARGVGLLVNSRVVRVATRYGSVWSVSPLIGLPSHIYDELYKRYSSLLGSSDTTPQKR